jgi:hypothetical protein
VGLTAALSARLAAIKQRQRGHDPGRVIRWAHASARARSWELHGASEWLTLDVDATLIAAHPDKEKAAGNDKGGFGFHPLQVYLDETREALGGLLRPGNGRFQHRRCADDHKAVIDRAPGQTPSEYVETLEILVRADSAGPTHGLVDYCREGNMRFSVGYEVTEPVRAAILATPAAPWMPGLRHWTRRQRAQQRRGHGSHHDGGSVGLGRGLPVDRAA